MRNVTTDRGRAAAPIRFRSIQGAKAQTHGLGKTSSRATQIRAARIQVQRYPAPHDVRRNHGRAESLRCSNTASWRVKTNLPPSFLPDGFPNMLIQRLEI